MDVQSAQCGQYFAVWMIDTQQYKHALVLQPRFHSCQIKAAVPSEIHQSDSTDSTKAFNQIKLLCEVWKHSDEQQFFISQQKKMMSNPALQPKLVVFLITKLN